MTSCWSKAVACFIAVSANTIRVQLPGGPLYAPAMLEAASKTGSRSGLPNKTISALSKMVELSVAALNSGKSAMITLEMQVHDDSIEARLIGKACASPTKKSLSNLEKLSEKRARSFATNATKAALTISFVV